MPLPPLDGFADASSQVSVVQMGFGQTQEATFSSQEANFKDSGSHVRNEDCYIVSGDDCVAIKSSWDEYGIAYGMPTQHIVIRRLTCVSPTSAVIALAAAASAAAATAAAAAAPAAKYAAGV